MFVTTVVTFLTMFLLSPSRAANARIQHYPTLHAARSGERVLIVAPHIDDEAIGAGGFALDAIANGAEVYVVFVTAGDCNRFSARILHKTLEPTASNYLAVGRTRIEEAKQAMRLMGVPDDHFFILGYPDRGLRAILDAPHAVVTSRGTHERSVPYYDALNPGAAYTYANLMGDIRHVIALTDPTTIIAPVNFDMHPDHAATAELTDLAIEATHSSATRLGYLVHASKMKSLVNSPGRALVPPARMQTFAWATYPLSARVLQQKNDVLMTYKSQRPYVFLLRNQFVRKNELFFVYPEVTPMSMTSVAAATAARLPIAAR